MPTTGVRSAEPDRRSIAEAKLPSRGADLGSRVIGERYRLNRLLHRGSAADVWHALSPDGGEWALKIAPGSADAAKASVAERERLRREHACLASLSHPSICRVEDWIETDTHSALVLQYLAGGDLVSLAGAPPRHWARPLRDLATALSFVHGHGLVHRDIKARNVLFDARDRARLVDFGSCVPVGSPWSVGGMTVEHRPPGWAGRVHTAGDDVYALAVLSHELIHGQLPSAAGPCPSLPRSLRSCRALSALQAHVVATLQASPEACAGNLAGFSAVIEWLIAESCGSTI